VIRGWAVRVDSNRRAQRAQLQMGIEQARPLQNPLYDSC